MKIQIDIAGATPTAPRFDLLRASFVAAQAATPTAQASANARRLPPIDDALVELFADNADDAARALRGSFSPPAVGDTARRQR